MNNVQGAIEEAFYIAFESVPNKNMTIKEIQQKLKQMNDYFLYPENDWNKRIDMIRLLRPLALCVINKNYEEEFFNFLNKFHVAYIQQINDLRSQIVREACITLAFLSRCFGKRLTNFVAPQIPHLISLIANAANIISSSGIVAIRILLENTCSSQLVPLICNGLQRKNKKIRCYCSQFLDTILSTWSTQCLEKHVDIIQHCIKTGLDEADEGVRFYSRKALYDFNLHFPIQAEILFSSIHPTRQEYLQLDVDKSFAECPQIETRLSISKCQKQNSESPVNDFSKRIDKMPSAISLQIETITELIVRYIEETDSKISLTSILILQNVICKMSYETCKKLLPLMLDPLLIAWDAVNPTIRKEAVVCLVSIFMIIGEDIRNSLDNLSSNKKKILNIYIEKAKENVNHVL